MAVPPPPAADPGSGAAPATTRVLVVEDTPEIADLVATALRYEGYHVEVATSGSTGLQSIMRSTWDLVLLDVMLPGLDGFAVQRELQALEAPPAVVLLTARDSTADKVRGLDLGAADYVTKPFSVEELLARVRSALRTVQAVRSARGDGGSVAGGTTSDVPRGVQLRVHDLQLDEDAHEVTRGGDTVELTPREFELLQYLMQNAGRVMSKAQILDAVWEYDFNGDANIVETYVSYLRRKLDTGEVKLLHTVRGVGYVVREPKGG